MMMIEMINSCEKILNMSMDLCAKGQRPSMAVITSKVKLLLIVFACIMRDSTHHCNYESLRFECKYGLGCTIMCVLLPQHIFATHHHYHHSCIISTN